MKKIDFEDYLQDKFIRDNPHTLDDEIPDAFEEWLSELSVDEMILYANQWGKSL